MCNGFWSHLTDDDLGQITTPSFHIIEVPLGLDKSLGSARRQGTK